MRNCFFLALVACTVFLNAHSLRDNNAHEGLQEDDVPQHQPVVSFQIDLNALGREQLDLVIKTLALGGAVPEGYDLSILPENIQFFVESLLQFPYTQRSLALKQVCPNFANDIDSYRNATAMERILAAALEITNTQLPTFFENLVTDCTQAHGPLTLNSEANYRTWFQDTLRTWFEQQYHARNALTEALKAVFGIEEEENDGMPMDVGEGILAPEEPGQSGMNGGDMPPPPPAQEEELDVADNGEDSDGEDSDGSSQHFLVDINFEEANPEAQALSHINTWSTPLDREPEALPPVIEQTLQILPAHTSPAFRSFAERALRDVFQLMTTIAYGPYYLTFLRTGALPAQPAAAPM